MRDAVRETSENGEIRCRFLRRHVEGEDTWIDIAKNREVWTDLVYELFHNAKDYLGNGMCVPHAHRFVFRSTVPNGFMHLHG